MEIILIRFQFFLIKYLWEPTTLVNPGESDHLHHFKCLVKDQNYHYPENQSY